MKPACHIYLAAVWAEGSDAGGRPHRFSELPFVRHLLRGHAKYRSDDVQICREVGGHPHADTSNGKIAFSLSHSGSLMALAIIEASMVGVDIEAERPIEHIRESAKIALEDEERLFHQQAPIDMRHCRFLAIWTRKEAVLKACGLGLFGKAKKLRVADSNRWLTEVRPPTPATPPLFVHSLELSGFQGVVAAEIPLKLKLHILRSVGLVGS